MTDYRFRVGTSVSIFWVLGSGALLAWKWPEALGMSPNEWGDFFAGCFAPLAFLWLVLGYLQQGQELRLSTEALRLQAEELKASVEQQRALVEVSRLQVESEREALAEERLATREAAKPKFGVESGGGSFRGDGHSTYPVTVTNAGNTACSFVCEIQYPFGRVQQLIKRPAFDRGETQRAQLEVAHPSQIEGATISMAFEDQLGNAYRAKYFVGRQSSDPHSSLRISRMDE